MRLEEIAKLIDGKLKGPSELEIKHIAGIEDADEGDITWLSHSRYEKWLEKSRASCIIINRESLIVNQERKVGIVISRRVKGSVVRNKLKRRLRDIYRRNKDNFKGEYIILAYPGAQLMSYSELREEVLRLGRQM